MPLLRLIDARDIRQELRPHQSTLRADPVDARTLATVAPIVDAVRERGEAAVREYAERFGELPHNPAGESPLVIGREEIVRRAASVPAEDVALLRRVDERIGAFARAQRAAWRDFEVAVPGGMAGHTLMPVESAGCYAPGGRYPLPSSVLMGASVARAAGVKRVVVASPKPAPITYAAAMVAGGVGVDEMLVVGGAHAIAAMAYGVGGGGGLGFGGAPVDLIVGPGNKFVTAAKKLVFGAVGIDMLAGPSELVVLEHEAAGGADLPRLAATIAADLLAQAEHDDDARPILVTTSGAVAAAVEAEVARQVDLLPEPNRTTARRACGNGFIAAAPTVGAAIDAVNALAPEHLEILTPDPSVVAARCLHAGAVFLGVGAAEVFGDYGVGPNHTLPTGGSARFAAGLSVSTFLRARTWLRMSSTAAGQGGVVGDTTRMARLEGLEAHARAAAVREPWAFGGQ